MKIAFFSIHPAPYRDPFLETLSKEKGIELHVYTYYKFDKGHDFWNLPPPRYDNHLLSPVPLTHSRLHRGLFKILFFMKFDFFCWPDYSTPTTLLGILLCILFKKPYAISADSISEPTQKTSVKKIKQILLTHASFLFVPGKASETFFRKNYSIRKICHGVYTMNFRSLLSDITRLKATRNENRKNLGIPPTATVFLMVANMTPSRCYPLTAEAFIRFSEKNPQCRFIMIGKGEDYNTIAQLATHYPALIPINGCTFSDLKTFYSIADIYIHGGTEQASTALMIGAAAGLPLISSPAVGCTRDYLENGATGLIVEDYQSVTQWENAFNRILTLRNTWEHMGLAAQKKIHLQTPEKIVGQFLHCVTNAVKTKKREA